MTNRPKHPLPILVIGAEYKAGSDRFTLESAIKTECGIQIKPASWDWGYVNELQPELIRMPCPYCGELWNLRSDGNLQIDLAEHIARLHQ